MLCTLIGAIILSINIQVGLNMHHMKTSGMHRRPFEGRHLVFFSHIILMQLNIKWHSYLKSTIIDLIWTKICNVTALVLRISVR